MLDIILLVFATSCDSLFMSIAYGMERIHIPWYAVLIITLCGTGCLGGSMVLAEFLSHLLSADLGKKISFVILLMLGIIHLFQAQVKRLVKKYKDRPLTIRFQEVSFVIDIMLDEKEADIDHSKELNSKEAFYLGVALSLDSLASGLAYGIGVADIPLVLLSSFIVGMLMIVIGRWLGFHIVRCVQADVSWISGTLLILLACLRLK